MHVTFLRFLGSVKWHRAVRPNPLPLGQVMVLHASNTLHTGLAVKIIGALIAIFL
jgi:hypothetical protein